MQLDADTLRRGENPADTAGKLLTVFGPAGHSAPRSRFSKISSHVGSIRIGLPQIRIEDGARERKGTVC
jgi:hypothetical protein